MKLTLSAMIRLTAVSLLLFPVHSVLAGIDDEQATAEEKDQVETKEVEVKELKLSVPANWKSVPNSSSMRLATFEIPPAEGDDVPGELTIFNFPGGGGDVSANLDRWTSQFASEGRTLEVTTGAAGDRRYIVHTASGTYHKPVGPPFQRQTEDVEGYRAINVILNHNEGSVYYLKLVGPDSTIQAVAESFRKSFGGNKEEEKEFEL